MQNMYYIGLDVHKRTISYCVKHGSGMIHAQRAIPATRFDLDRWMKTLPQPWTAAMEATVFTGWIYDHLRPHAAALKVAHPLMLRAIAAAKKKNERNHRREARERTEEPEDLLYRASRKRARRAFALLTRTYHGCRQFGDEPERSI